MIKDDVLYGNLLGLLKTGKWTMGASEAVALVKIIHELERRLTPPLVKEVEEPIKNEVKAKKNGNK
jgi:hypothetical protein